MRPYRILSQRHPPIKHVEGRLMPRSVGMVNECVNTYRNDSRSGLPWILACAQALEQINGPWRLSGSDSSSRGE